MKTYTPLLLLAPATAYTINRRTAAATAAAAVFGLHVENASAIATCKPNANNCVEGTIKAPSGASKEDIIKDVRSAIEAYPQVGQDKVDEGGWSVAVDDLDGAGTAKVEYKSSGKGTFAKLFNGGKPFVDDLDLEVTSDGVAFKSASRVGDSDFGVNGKRMDYIKGLLAKKGWA